MAISYKRRAVVSVANDIDFELLVADRDRTITDSTLESSATFVRQLAASANVQVDLGEIATLKGLAIEYSAAVNLRLGAADADPLPLKPVSEGQTGFTVIELETDDGVWLQNPSSTAAVSVTLVAVGNN
ncbi:MAG TPA: hypothetical protein PLU52_11065 [Opitutaceae bacterium]|nr:hypothetical protein [Opitutaceae bacterium]